MSSTRFVPPDPATPTLDRERSPHRHPTRTPHRARSHTQAQSHPSASQPSTGAATHRHVERRTRHPPCRGSDHVIEALQVPARRGARPSGGTPGADRLARCLPRPVAAHPRCGPAQSPPDARTACQGRRVAGHPHGRLGARSRKPEGHLHRPLSLRLLSPTPAAASGPGEGAPAPTDPALTYL